MTCFSLLGYVSDFSPDGRLFALLDSDGKLKIWDTKHSRLTQEYVPNLHLSSPYTCFVWFASKVGDLEILCPEIGLILRI